MVRVGAVLWQEVGGQLAELVGSVFAQARSRQTAWDYIEALLADTPRRSCWQLGELAGHQSPRRMQALLGEYVWDAAALVEQVRRFVTAHLADDQAVLAIDETAEIKKGTHTVAVARQYAGVTGQVENCQTVVLAAYVTARAYTLVDFRLYLPKRWAGDPVARARAGVPEQIRFATKPELGVALVQAAAAAGMPFRWIVADEVYGRGPALREAAEKLGKGYVLAVPSTFTIDLGPPGVYTVVQLVNLVNEDWWEQRSCGRGCKGHRWYQWAWIATASPTHWVLARRRCDRPEVVDYFYCHAPAGATLATLIRVTGQRWPVETCIQHAKGLGIAAHQVRGWDPWHRHTALALAAGALRAVAAAKPAATAPAAPLPQPDAWRDSAPLPNTADQQPPDDTGMIGVTVPEARRLFNLAATATDTTILMFHLGWSDWRRLHQTRARRSHYQRQRLKHHKVRLPSSAKTFCDLAWTVFLVTLNSALRARRSQKYEL
jgi:SRSO17 transposase